MYLEPKGRNWGDIVNWDDLGKLYAAIICLWTLILIFGVTWLILNRRLPHVKIRNLPLAIVSTLFLHIYLVKILLAYTTNGHFLCSAEFWIMSIYLPFGIALFQAYLTQLRSIWEQQQHLVRNDGLRHAIHVGSRASMVERWMRLSRLKKSYCFIAVGMLVQLILTSILYARTPTLQGDWSSYGKITHAKGQALCRKSLPWVTSAFWQLFWSWIYGPYTLFKIRHIQDIHYWRLQVVISVIIGLPGTPLWLAALYLPQFKPVNMRFVPPMWLAPGIIVIQFVTIFVPMFETWSLNRIHQRSVSLLSSEGSEYINSYQSSNPTSSSKPSIENPGNSQPLPSPTIETRVFSLPSLRAALTLNPKPLLDFAATKEFSAENILFLLRVRNWQSGWSTAAKTGQVTATAITHLFHTAVDIYIDLINEHTADFPINLEFSTKKALDIIFESAANQRSPQNTVNIFDISTSFQTSLARMKPIRADTDDSERTIWDNTDTQVDAVKHSEICIKLEEEEEAVIPPGFGENVFDDALKSIEYLVLTNTWPKFVKHSRGQ